MLVGTNTLLLRRGTGFRSSRWLLRAAPAHGRTGGASLQSLCDLLRREVRRAAERHSLSSSTAFPSFHPVECQPRSQLEAAAGVTSRASAKALWDAASPWYYRQVPVHERQRGGTAAATEPVIVVPFDWRTAVLATAAALPYEGVTEADFVHLLVDQCRDLSVASGAELASLLGYDGVPSVASWVCTHFADAVLVTRSAVTGEPLFANLRDNNVLPPTRPRAGERQEREVAAMHHALHLLGRDKQLPVWTDFARLAPLLPADVCPPTGAWSSFLAQPHLSAVFDVEADVGVRYAGQPTNTFVFIDRTSVSAEEAEAWLARLRASSSEAAAPDIRVLVRPGAEGDEGVVGTMRAAEVVVVERLLDPEHVIGALVSILQPAAADEREETGESDTSKAAAAASSEEHVEATSATRAVHVLCSEGNVGAITKALREVQTAEQRRRNGDGLAVYVHTPSTPDGVLLANG